MKLSGRAPWRGRGSAVLVLVLALAPDLARADAGELLLGAGAAFELPAAAGAGAFAQLGLTDALAARVSLGGRYGPAGGAAEVMAGLVWAWDVLAWVPEVSLQGGARTGDGANGQVLAELALRYFVSPGWSATCSAGVGLRGGGPYGVATLALWYGVR